MGQSVAVGRDRHRTARDKLKSEGLVSAMAGGMSTHGLPEGPRNSRRRCLRISKVRRGDLRNQKIGPPTLDVDSDRTATSVRSSGSPGIHRAYGLPHNTRLISWSSATHGYVRASCPTRHQMASGSTSTAQRSRPLCARLRACSSGNQCHNMRCRALRLLASMSICIRSTLATRAMLIGILG